MEAVLRSRSSHRDHLGMSIPESVDGVSQCCWLITSAQTIQVHVLVYLFLVVLGIKPRALYMLGKHSTIQINPQPQSQSSGSKNDRTKLWTRSSQHFEWKKLVNSTVER
jgi:hypothetical protein